MAAGDFPPNPLVKAGYRLDFHDEFDSPALDTARWLPFYLPQWSSRARSAPRFDIADGCLSLHIMDDQKPWCPEFDGQVRCSSLQTGVYAGPLGSPIGQHRFSPACRVREAQARQVSYAPQFGYFEIRAQAVAAPFSHVAFWMIGYEDAPERSGEIAICEIMGDQVGPASAQVGYGLHPWHDPALTDEFYVDSHALDATCFHLYAAEWTPDYIDFYVDNALTRTIPQSPDYPMQFMLSIYERPPGGSSAAAPAAPYPKTFTIDYVRAYQPLSGY